MSNNNCPAIFQIECAASVSNVEIPTLVQQALISMFGLNIDNIETMTFVLFNRQLHLLNNKLHEPFKMMSIACIPTCELLTKDYPKKGVERDKYINFAPFLYSSMWMDNTHCITGNE